MDRERAIEILAAQVCCITCESHNHKDFCKNYCPWSCSEDCENTKFSVELLTQAILVATEK